VSGQYALLSPKTHAYFTQALIRYSLKRLLCRLPTAVTVDRLLSLHIAKAQAPLLEKSPTGATRHKRHPPKLHKAKAQ
jgi:hypothetical protein